MTAVALLDSSTSTPPAGAAAGSDSCPVTARSHTLFACCSVSVTGLCACAGALMQSRKATARGRAHGERGTIEDCGMIP